MGKLKERKRMLLSGYRIMSKQPNEKYMERVEKKLC
jgi:hypothetical protein